MILLLIVILVLIILIATLLESVFGMNHYVAGYMAMAIVGAVIVAILGFYLLTAKGRAIVRTWNINDLRKKRIDREFHESWRRMNKKFIAKENRRISREVDRIGEDHSSHKEDSPNIAPIIVYNQLHNSGGTN